ncbi:hypothetical protein HU200_044369 [Digitaria exilis]|uniref:Pentatricopeptide repeat-containing protein n=1 Tax=Digitaria exilis TaxID=1010633 RepID=A0A835B2Z9_9POAL|nr:hypothetical protein HU200_044369 [Digitaria exilis]
MASTASFRSSAPTRPTPPPRAPSPRPLRRSGPPSTFLSNRVLHLLSSHPATLPDALALLSSLPSPDVCSYNTLVAALARSPRRPRRPRPRYKGLEIFHSIKDEYGIDHTADHYACVIDLLSRSGQFELAEEMINKMAVKPNKFLMGVLAWWLPDSTKCPPRKMGS